MEVKKLLRHSQVALLKFSSASLFLCRQIIAYKNLIQALENINIAMILALGFFINGKLSPIDYREFIRTNALSYEQLESARHFLQQETLFTDAIELELKKWYSKFTERVTITNQDGYFDTRHGFVNESIDSGATMENGTKYLFFMRDEVLPRIVDFQQIVRSEIRCFWVNLRPRITFHQQLFFVINSVTLDFDMHEAETLEITSLVLLLLVVVLSPVIIFLVKNATSTIQVSFLP